jgi:hypothetical protein
MNFPNLSRYTLALARMDKGLELTALIAFTAVVWLCLARFSWPRLLPALRMAAFVAFYLSLGLIVIGVLK